MDATQLPKQQSKEINTDGRPVNEPGIYVHKDTKAVFITAEGLDGITQADYLMNPLWEHAWERTGEVPSRTELLEMRKAQADKEAAALIEAPEKAEKLPSGGETYTPGAAN